MRNQSGTERIESVSFLCFFSRCKWCVYVSRALPAIRFPPGKFKAVGADEGSIMADI